MRLNEGRPSEQALVPTLRPADIVVLGYLTLHKQPEAQAAVHGIPAPESPRKSPKGLVPPKQQM